MKISRRQFTKLSLTGSAAMLAGSVMGLGAFAPGSNNLIKIGDSTEVKFIKNVKQ